VGYSLTVHGPDEFYDVQGQYLVEKIAAADFVVCISSYTRSQLMKLSPYADWSKFFVARLGVDVSVFSSMDRNPPDCFEILCVGRLVPAKGQHLLIAAIERLTLEGRRVQLRLVGDGPDEASLRTQAARILHPECVVFEGAVNQDRIRSLYAAAHVFCLPSFAEGLPVVLMEAMAMGIPCVSTSIAGIPELIRNEMDGLLVAAGDTDALVASLGRLMDDSGLCTRLATSGRARVFEQHNLTRNIKSLAEVFTERIRV
jgi:glycosyltransferase involved in cell wall biosynthesis